MTDENDREIYRQRYETYRHLDRTRWLLLQIAAGSVGVVFAVAAQDGGLQSWHFLSAGGILAVVAIALEAIRDGIGSNALVLRKSAEAVGDEGIPVRQPYHNQRSFWIEVIMIVLSAAFFFVGLHKTISIY